MGPLKTGNSYMQECYRLSLEKPKIFRNRVRKKL
jgi:hypothetical protein